MRVVPSIGSTAMSVSGAEPSPTCSPLKSIGASSFSPSPMTTTPSIDDAVEHDVPWPRPRHRRRRSRRRGKPIQRPPCASAAASVARIELHREVAIRTLLEFPSVFLSRPAGGRATLVGTPPPGREAAGRPERAVELVTLRSGVRVGSLEGKVALVTGASSGIGFAVWRVVRAGGRPCGRSRPVGAAAHDHRRSCGRAPEVSFVEADVRDEAAIAGVVERGRRRARPHRRVGRDRGRHRGRRLRAQSRP